MKFLFGHSGVADSELARSFEALAPHLSRVRSVALDAYPNEEAFLGVPFDTELFEASRGVLYEKATPDLKYIVVIGIGGSNLGTQAVYEALAGDMPEGTPRPKMLFADTVDSQKIKSIAQFIEGRDAGEVLFVLVSKSGTTTESIANFSWLFGTYAASAFAFPDEVWERVVVITDEGSKLWSFAAERGVAVLPIPARVGGRYSVFTPVGVLPLSLAGIDTAKLLQGAREMRERCLGDGQENPAFVSAALAHIHALGGKNISNHFFFVPTLESLGKWYRQLMGESIGKEKDREGNTVHVGITPIVSIGSTDLHSMAQLYLGGPLDKFTHFVTTEGGDESPRVSEGGTSDLAGGLAGRSFPEIMRAIYGGVARAYENRGLPYAEVVFPEVNEYELGAFMQFKMMEIMFLAQLFGVNAFDQPNVEEYKQEMRKLLQ